MKVLEFMRELPAEKKVFIRYRGVTFPCWPYELAKWACYDIKRVETTANIKVIVLK